MILFCSSVQNQISKQDDTLSSKQRELSKCQGEIKSASESQASVLKQIKMLQTIKERTEKKLKWGVNDLKVSQMHALINSRLIAV